MRGSYDTGDPLTTNLYVGNINPKVCVCVCVCVCDRHTCVLFTTVKEQR